MKFTDLPGASRTGKRRDAHRRSVSRVAVLGIVLAASMVRAEAPIVLTLARGVELALERNPALINARRERDKARASIAEARSAAFPGVNLDLLYNRSWIQGGAVFTVEGEDDEGNPVKKTQSVTFGQPNLFSAGLSVQQTLYAGGKVRHGLKAAEVFADQKRIDVQSAEQEVCYQVRRAFLGALMAQEAIEVAQLAVDQAQAHLDQVRQRHDRGNAAEFDLLRAQVEVANLHPPLIAARNAYQRAVEQLKNTIGMDMYQAVSVEGDLWTLAGQLADQLAPALAARTGAQTREETPLQYDLDHAVRIALQHRPEVRFLGLQTDLLAQQLAIDQGGKRPSLALVGSYELQWQLPDELRVKDEDLLDSWTTGLALSWPLFDGGRTKAQVARTQTVIRQVGTQQQQLADRIFLEVKNSLLDLQEAREKIQAQQQTIAQAERGLSIARVRFESGVATQLEALDAQLALTAARTQHLQAQHDYAVALATLSYATGLSTPAAEL